MSTYPAHGSSGSVDFTSTAVGKVTSWTYDGTVDVAEVVYMGASAATYTPSSVVKGSGTIELVFDQDDTGQAMCIIGASITPHLYFDGETATDDELTGSAVISGINWVHDVGDVAKMSVNYNGVLALAVVG